MKYKIYELNIEATYIASLIKIQYNLFFKNKETIIEKEFSGDIFSKLMVATEEEMDKLVEDNCPNDDLIPHAESSLFWETLSNNDGYTPYTKILPKIIDSKTTYKEIEFNSKNIKYWIEKLDAKDLIIIINQENLDALELIKQSI